MEARAYFNLILRYAWLIILIMVVAGVGTAVVDSMREPTYRATARVVVRPAAGLSEERTTVDMVAQMGARFIPGTFAQIVTSAAVEADAQKAVGLSAAAATDYPVEANVLPDTAVVELAMTGRDPVLLAKYLNATVDATIKNSKDLFRVVDLVPLETVQPPQNKISPVPSRDIPLAVGLGLAAGVLLALALGYIRAPAPTPVARPVDHPQPVLSADRG
jgi:capsular polysaccharide biosynthesis protein